MDWNVWNIVRRNVNRILVRRILRKDVVTTPRMGGSYETEYYENTL
jgi:hypothetical protein